MAQALTPPANNSIEYHTSPLAEPSHTSFPRSSSSSASGSSAPRQHSDRTLLNQTSIEDGASADEFHAATSRPTLPSKKYETELLKPVGVRPVLPAEQRHSQGARPDTNLPLGVNELSSPTSDSDSSSDEDEEPAVDLARQSSLPEKKDLGTRELNRARLRPWHENRHRHFTFDDEFLHGRGRLARDGRLNVRISEKGNTGYLAKALGSALQCHLHPNAQQARRDADQRKQQYASQRENTVIPRMNIVVMVIGSRGDIQPFLKIGQILRDKYGHRVRVATHPAFRDFVQKEIGLEFFSVGGDPSELMAFMVRNPGLIPGLESLKSGEVGRRREGMYEMFNGFWRACINTTDDETDTANLKMLGNKFPFIADAIIANPVSFAHYHCAERLGIPLHLVFTFPYTPTTSFPHPLANIKSSSVDREYTNYMSYPLVDLMTWQGLGDLVNRFRVKTLGLEPVSTLWAPGAITRLRVPMTYLWSPGLVPKPEDWGPEIDIAGYVFLDLAKSYKAPSDLVDFLKRADNDTRSIIYIGFGSISGIKDARAFCQLIFDAVEQAGVRAVVSRGWGGMGDGMDIPDSIFMVDNVPHDWLFPQIDAVVHHGGAGTTAIGLKLGKPTMIVPFFGDQPFWANMIARARAGAREVWPLKKLTVERFVTSINQCLEPESKTNAEAIAKSISLEGDGAENMVDSFHRGLNLTGEHSLRCGVFNNRIAVWRVRHTDLRLSALAADLLIENKQLQLSDLELIRHKQWADFSGPGEPITGAGGVVVGAFQEALHGISEIHDDTRADMKRIERRRRKRKGQTVADAVLLPGKIAQHARVSSQDESAEARTLEQVNLTGDAEPIKKPGVAGVLGNAEETRPPATRVETTSTLHDPAPVVLAKDVGRGFGHSLKAVVLLPMDMLHAVTLGFRNAPRLYGDRTVRPPPQNIRGLRQGIQIAGREFGLGIYDGATGLIRIPYLDYQENGLSALPKGMARGVGGLVLKPVAGTLGLVNYTNKGCYASLRRRIRDTEKTDRWIRRARLAQGAGEVKDLREKQIKRREAEHNVPHGAIQGLAPGFDGPDELEDARTRVMTKWTSYDREKLERARQQESRTSIALRPKKEQRESAGVNSA